MRNAYKIYFSLPVKLLVTLFIVLLVSSSCKKELPKGKGLKQGVWRGVITTQKQEIPFNFKVSKKDDKITIDLINGDETLPIDDVYLIKDTLSFNLHIFDIEIRAKIDSTSMSGVYVKNYIDDYVLPFRADYGKEGRFDNVSSNGNFDGKWKTVFKSRDGKETPAIGLFKTEDNKLKGTFMTSAGDYRFLDGFTKKDTMYLYSFDGNHLFKFRAFKVNDSLLNGEFWSGKSGYKTFVSVKNDTAKLPDPDKLTYLKPGYEKIQFNFKDLDGNTVNLNDKKYQDKVVILQIFGTWCPNCMDETKFLSEWYKKNKDRGVEIIGLAFENKDDFEYAKHRVEVMKEKLGVEYDFLIAGIPKKASESLPMINDVMSFPTMIIIGKNGKVQKIHTGFNGPATGVYFEEFKENFNELINKLTKEK